MPGPATDKSFQPLSDGTYLRVSAHPNLDKHGYRFSVQTEAGAVIAHGTLLRGTLRAISGALSPEAAAQIHEAAKGTAHSGEYVPPVPPVPAAPPPKLTRAARAG